jgi:hypothetical protein
MFPIKVHAHVDQFISCVNAHKIGIKPGTCLRIPSLTQVGSTDITGA